VESRLLSDHVVVQTAARLVTLRFPRGRSSLVETVRARLEEMVRSGGSDKMEDGAENAGAERGVVELAPLPAL
jgi:hypothetical protein